MKATSLKFDVEGFDGGIESHRVGDHVEILYQGMPVMAFDVRDLTARDWTIASLLETKLKGKTVALLCHTSTAQVSMVRKLVRQGGHEALIHPPQGRSKKLTGARLMRAMDLRKGGSTHFQIGKALGVSRSTVCRAVADIPRGRTKGHQEVLLCGVGGSTTQRGVSSTDDPSCESSKVVAIDQPDDNEQSATVAQPLEKSEAQKSYLSTTESPSAAKITEHPGTSSGGIEPASVVVDGPTEPPVESSSDEPKTKKVTKKPQELIPAKPLPPGPAVHPCRYAGTLLICAAVQMLGLRRAVSVANVERPESSWYDGWQAVVALLSAWAGGFGSLEAMHERDARALGVVLGLERSPSVRTLHRAIAQMVATFDPVALGSAMLRGLMAVVDQVPRVFGIDGHFKPYFGTESIDKGWNTKRRMAHRGVADVLIHDEQGRIWAGTEVGASESLHDHVLSSAKQIRHELGNEASVVMACDRGGFSFEVLDRLDREGFGYVMWVPSSVSLPDLSSIAPPTDGVGEQLWVHSKIRTGHRARLLVQRDGETCVPAVTNLPAETGADEALKMLRSVRGWQENDIKAARAFAHIDRLVDRGGARHARDDRKVDNPLYQDLSAKRREARNRLEELDRRIPLSRQDQTDWGDRMTAEFEEVVLTHKMKDISAKVERCELEPEAQRAWLVTRNRSLLQPLKYGLANGRRWLLNTLESALAPSDADCDRTAVARTLQALIRAPGTVLFNQETVVVTLDLPLPPQPHERLARGLQSLDDFGLRFSDGQRLVLFRLAPRPTHDSLPSASPSAREI